VLYVSVIEGVILSSNPRTVQSRHHPEQSPLSPTFLPTASGSCSSPTERTLPAIPEHKDVMLRPDDAGRQEDYGMANLFGGQGTINVPSWSPDCTQLAFVSYLLVPPESAAADK
jgi:hypothetical protein